VALLDFWTLQSLFGFEQCEPRDSACVGRNQQRSVAVEDYWISHQGRVPVGTVINFVPDTSQAAMLAFMANQPITETPGGGGSTNGQTTAAAETAYYAAMPATPAAQEVKAVNASNQNQYGTPIPAAPSSPAAAASSTPTPSTPYSPVTGSPSGSDLQVVSTPLTSVVQAYDQAKETVQTALNSAAQFPWWLWAGVAAAVIFMQRRNQQ
jgi:hypothetical protein